MGRHERSTGVEEERRVVAWREVEGRGQETDQDSGPSRSSMEPEPSSWTQVMVMGIIM